MAGYIIIHSYNNCNFRPWRYCRRRCGYRLNIIPYLFNPDLLFLFLPAEAEHREYKLIRKKLMPYDNLSDLPDSVRDNLPRHAQEIYKEAYNSAWEEYKDPGDRQGDASREETSHRVAWSAVKNKYKKKGDKWVKKEGSSD